MSDFEELIQKHDGITIVVSVALQDAGEATRSLHIMEAVKKMALDENKLRIIFFSHGSKFDQKVIERGFEIFDVKPHMKGEGYIEDLKPSNNNFVGDLDLAIQMIEGEVEALKICRPDLVIHGFWPMASLARRIVNPTIPGICFLPLPLEPQLYSKYLMEDIPDPIRPLTYLPEPIRRKIMGIIPNRLKLKAPILKQTNLIQAGKKCGLHTEKLENLFDLLKADFTIVNDYKGFYEEMPIPSNYVVTGTLFAQVSMGQKLEPNLLKHFDKAERNQTNIFCSMGSSAKKEQLLEAIKAIVDLPQEIYRACILVPKAICPLEEMLPFVQENDNIILTDEFVPAMLINQKADLVICHGGQGTLQTAMVSGTPIIAFAMQPEQQINIDHIVKAKAGIRIPITRWHKKNIKKAIKTMMEKPFYKINAQTLGEKMAQSQGQKESAFAIWKFIKESID